MIVITIENWIQFLIPVIGSFLAVTSVALSYYFSKKKEILSDERRLKEKLFFEYLEALSNNMSSDDLETSRGRMASAQNNILLIGSVDVVKKLMVFADYIGPTKRKEFTQADHNMLLTELIKSMRIDLYKQNNVNNEYPLIAFFGKHRRNTNRH